MLNKTIPSGAALAIILCVGYGAKFFLRSVGNSYIPHRDDATTLVESVPATRLDLHCPSIHGAREYHATQLGMTFEQVKHIFRIVRLSKDASSYINAPDLLARFLSPDGSSIQLVFHNGKVIHKQRYDAMMTREIENHRVIESQPINNES